MAVESYETQLERVQAAIAAVEGGAQSASYDGMTVSRADLAALHAREQHLRRMVARSARGGRIRVRGITPA